MSRLPNNEISGAMKLLEPWNAWNYENLEPFDPLKIGLET